MIIILILILAVLFVFEYITFIVYGGFISKEDINFYMNLDERNITINPWDNEILSLLYCNPPRPIKLHYIDYTPYSLFSKYNINEIGLVPRWSKLHKKISKYYIIARKNNEKYKIF
jgi:hypothetical protein